MWLLLAELAATVLWVVARVLLCGCQGVLGCFSLLLECFFGVVLVCWYSDA